MKNFTLLLTVFCTLSIQNVKSENITLSFTSSGKANYLDSIQVVNLNTGATVTTTGTVFLTDVFSDNNDLHIADFKISPTPGLGSYSAQFNSLNPGLCNFQIFTVDGKAIFSAAKYVNPGINQVNFTIRKGVFIVRVFGDGYNYATKVFNSNNVNSPEDRVEFVESLGKNNGIFRVKSEDSTPALLFHKGDKILAKGYFGNYSNIIIDSPETDKTINFVQTECKDASGNYYSTVKIGNKIWMAENLKTKKYRTGDNVLNFSGNNDWGFYTIGSFCVYGNSEPHLTTYGLLYNWYAINDGRNIAPDGWHVATDAEWSDLMAVLGGATLAGSKIKETRQSVWSALEYATNSSGFSGLPCGMRQSSGSFTGLNTNAAWWTSTENSGTYGWYWSVNNISNSLTRDFFNKNTGFAIRCVKDPEPPVIKAIVPEKITYTTIISGRIIVDNGGSTLISSGVCWSQNPVPTIADNKTVETSQADTVLSQLTGLKPGEKYYLRAYATTNTGTVYSDIHEVSTQDYDTIVTDIDGNAYHVVTIGNQQWMVENLKTTRYRNGDIIGTTSYPNQNIFDQTSPKYQWAYNGNETNVASYGRLYTWFTVADLRKIAPEGWHIPTVYEIDSLQNYLIENGYNYDMTTNDNKIAKALSSSSQWFSNTIQGTVGYNLQTNNRSGFSIMPSGYKGYDGYFYELRNFAYLWTASSNVNNTAYSISVRSDQANLIRNLHNKNYGFSVRCIKNTIPITSNALIQAKSTSLTLKGAVLFDGGDPVTEIGFCYNVGSQPNVSDNKVVSSGTDLSNFSMEITGLVPETEYYVRAYSFNKHGVSYGNVIKVKTPLTDPETVVDIDGNVYNTVEIGNQTWMVENLRVTKYNDGTPLVFTTSGIDWLNQSTGAYCWPQDDITYKSVYGGFYNWYAVSSGKLAPVGWHIPTEEDWITLATYLGGASVAGGKIKAAGIQYWTSPNSGATNETGFTALPAGYRSMTNGGNPSMGVVAVFWSSTGNINSYGRLSLDYSNSVFNYGNEFGNFGFSVRCIKNVE